MKTRIAAVLLTLMFFAGTVYSQQQGKSKQQKSPVNTEKSSEMPKSSSERRDPGIKAQGMDQHKTTEEETDTAKKTVKQDAAVVYTCPMHPDVTSDKPGKCPKCGMGLVIKK